MSIIKEIYDVTKDLAGNKIALNKIKRALLRSSLTINFLKIYLTMKKD